MSLTSYQTAPPRGNDIGCPMRRAIVKRLTVGVMRPRNLMISARVLSDLRRPGGDLLSHALRRSTIGAEGFHGRVRDGIGWSTLAITTRPSKRVAGQARMLGRAWPRRLMSGAVFHREIRVHGFGLVPAHGALSSLSSD